MENVLVFFGGVSCEHDISVITGVMTVNSLRSPYRGIPVYVNREGKWFTGEKLKDVGFYRKFDERKVKRVCLIAGESCLYEVKRRGKKTEVACALNCMHGLNGEDGTLAGVLRMSDIPLASPSVCPSAVCMDKYYSKLILAGLDVSYLPYVKIDRENYFEKRELAEKMIVQKLGFPLIVKPACLGSSIGITVVKRKEDLSAALAEAFRYDGKAIAEQALEKFREINCAAYKSGKGIVVSECEEPFVAHDILTFGDKYEGEGRKKFPAEIDERLSSRIRETTKYVYRKLGFVGVIRVDFLLDGDKIYVNEINTVPGSLAYYLFCRSTEEFPDMLAGIVKTGIADHEDYKSNEFTYSSGSLFAGACLKKGGKGE